MSQEHNEPMQIQQITGLKPKHFADLIRSAQLIFDPAAGLSGRNLIIDWREFGIPLDVAENLKSLGDQYQYASPHVPIEIVWSHLTPETRVWFIEHKDELWRLEEAFPALDED
jgi:RNAse (barnase) inhibitor barstar